jgi:hydroxyacyl-ACP dehydratase HTD2-like protein with hotdog domain
LGFVTREHQYFCDDELRVDEVQNIVFHVESSADALPVSPPLVAAWLMLKPDK